MVSLWGLKMGPYLCCLGELQRSSAGCRDQDVLHFLSHASTFLVPRVLCDRLLHSVRWWSRQWYGAHPHRPTRQCTFLLLLLLFFLPLNEFVLWATIGCVSVFAGFPQVSLDWSSNKAQPGEQVSLTVSGLEPHSQFAIIVVGADSELPRTDPDVTVEQVYTQDTTFCQCFYQLCCTSLAENKQQIPHSYLSRSWQHPWSTQSLTLIACLCFFPNMWKVQPLNL